MVKHYNHTTNVSNQGSNMAHRANYLDLDPTYRDIYGRPLLRMTFDVDRVSADLWNFLTTAFALAVLSFAGGLLLIWFPLKSWLEPLQNLQWAGVQQDVNASFLVDANLIASAPAEFRQTLVALSGTALRLRSELGEREAALESLRNIIASLMPDYSGEDQHGKDIGAIRVGVIGKTSQGRELPYVIASRPLVTSPTVRSAASITGA